MANAMLKDSLLPVEIIADAEWYWGTHHTKAYVVKVPGYTAPRIVYADDLLIGVYDG